MTYLLNKTAWKKRVYSILSLDSHPGHIAAGFAVGVFISFTPFFGMHTPLAVVAAFVFRLNKLTCITGAWINTPITMIPVLGLSYELGLFMQGLPVDQLTLEDGLKWESLQAHATSLLLGSSILGFIAAVIAYFACYYLVIRFRAKDEAQAALAKQMDEVGEELE